MSMSVRIYIYECEMYVLRSKKESQLILKSFDKLAVSFSIFLKN